MHMKAERNKMYKKQSSERRTPARLFVYGTPSLSNLPFHFMELFAFFNDY